MSIELASEMANTIQQNVRDDTLLPGVGFIFGHFIS